jgi:hypothetical protein
LICRLALVALPIAPQRMVARRFLRARAGAGLITDPAPG